MAAAATVRTQGARGYHDCSVAAVRDQITAEFDGLPFLGELPLALEVRVAGDAGTPIAAGDGPQAEAYAKLAHRLIAGGMA